MIKCLAVLLSLFPSPPRGGGRGPTCWRAPPPKKLAGAAKTSFLKKCEKDATAACQAASKEKKLSGAAKTSFEKKCIQDAVG